MSEKGVFAFVGYQKTAVSSWLGCSCSEIYSLRCNIKDFLEADCSPPSVCNIFDYWGPFNLNFIYNKPQGNPSFSCFAAPSWYKGQWSNFLKGGTWEGAEKAFVPRRTERPDEGKASVIPVNMLYNGTAQSLKIQRNLILKCRPPSAILYILHSRKPPCSYLNAGWWIVLWRKSLEITTNEFLHHSSQKLLSPT